MGKSSLLNALFGQHKVKASRTPGKVSPESGHRRIFNSPTVHRRSTSRRSSGPQRSASLTARGSSCPVSSQWRPRCANCLPRHLTTPTLPTITNRAPRQVLAAILPISRVSAVALCTHHAAQLLPLERILQLAHPASAAPLAEDRRTWREGTRPRAEAGAAAQAWTAMDVLTAYALRKGWVTAKAGRPDVSRAGNASKFPNPY